jgi:hypothetical protein
VDLSGVNLPWSLVARITSAATATRAAIPRNAAFAKRRSTATQIARKLIVDLIRQTTLGRAVDS